MTRWTPLLIGAGGLIGLAVAALALPAGQSVLGRMPGAAGVPGTSDVPSAVSVSPTVTPGYHGVPSTIHPGPGPDDPGSDVVADYTGSGDVGNDTGSGDVAAPDPARPESTLFSDDFDSGSASGWSTSGGWWLVVQDGSPVYWQVNPGSEHARTFNGDTGWRDYQVQARVKPLWFTGPDRLVALAARVDSATRMYRLALINNNRVELQSMDDGSITVIGSASLSISAGTWYTLRIEVSGSTVRGFVDGTLVGSGTDTQYGRGRIGLFTEYATASFDDVVVTGSGSTP